MREPLHTSREKGLAGTPRGFCRLFEAQALLYPCQLSRFIDSHPEACPSAQPAEAGSAVAVEQNHRSNTNLGLRETLIGTSLRAGECMVALLVSMKLSLLRVPSLSRNAPCVRQRSPHLSSMKSPAQGRSLQVLLAPGLRGGHYMWPCWNQYTRRSSPRWYVNLYRGTST